MALVQRRASLGVRASANARYAGIGLRAGVAIVAHGSRGGHAGSRGRRTCVAPSARVPRVLPSASIVARAWLIAIALSGGGRARTRARRCAPAAKVRTRESRVLPSAVVVAELWLEQVALLGPRRAHTDAGRGARAADVGAGRSRILPLAT